MALELKEYIRGLVTCAWCGNVKSKKVQVAGLEGKKIIVCRRHFTRKDGTLVNEPTADAIIRVRDSRT